MRRLREQKKWVFLALFAMIILTGSTFTQSRAILPIQAPNRGASPIWAERMSEEEAALVEEESVEVLAEKVSDEETQGWDQPDKPVPPGQAKKYEVPIEEVPDEPVEAVEDSPAIDLVVDEEVPAAPAEENPGHQNGQQGNENADDEGIEEEQESIVSDDEAEDPVVPEEKSGQGQGNNPHDATVPNQDPVVETGQGGQGEEADEVEAVLGLSSDSTLFTILIDGKRIPGFDPAKKDYPYVFEADIQVLPSIYAVANHEAATVKYSTVTQLPDTMVIQVTAEDRSKTHYHLHLTAEGLKEGEVILLLEAIPELTVPDMLGLWLPPTEEEFELGKGSAPIRFWVSDPLLTPEIWIYDPAGSTTDAVIKISTGELKMNTGSGKHARATVASGEGGFYKYNLKLKSFPDLEIGERYALAIMNGGEQVYFGDNVPAVIHFTVVEAFKEAPSNRNRTDDKSQGRSNAGGKR